MVSEAARRGIFVGEHRSRVVDEAMLRAADVVVTMERRHARELVVMAPEIGHRIHTLLGLVASAPNVPAGGDLDHWLRDVTAGREASDLMGDRGPDQIPDPYGRARRHYRTCLDTLDHAVDGLVELLGALA